MKCLLYSYCISPIASQAIFAFHARESTITVSTRRARRKGLAFEDPIKRPPRHPRPESRGDRRLAALAGFAVRPGAGKIRLHGRINLVFFVLTVSALFVFEVIIRLLNRDAFVYFSADPVLRHALNVHLCFSVPSALLMPFMLYTGLSHRRTAHLILAFIFGVLWFGTFVTGVFFLPHTTMP